MARRGDNDRLLDHLAHLRLRGLRPQSIDQRRYAVRRLARWLDANPLYATEEQLLGWQRSLTMSAVGHRTEVMHVHGYYKWAVEEKLIRTDPSRRLVLPKKPHTIPRPIPEEHLRLALDEAPPYLRAQLVLAAWCGLRAAEIALLQRQHVMDTADPPVLLVTNGKGGRQRVVPIGDRVLAVLREYGMPSRGVVFPRLDGRPGPNTPARVSQRACRYLHDVGIPSGLHSLRHRYGTQVYRASQDLRLVGSLMGHNDPATTAGYVAYSAEGAVAAIRALDESLPSAARDGRANG